MPKMTAEEIKDFMKKFFPQARMPVEIEELRDGFLRMRVGVTDRHLRPGGTVSGPAMFGLADVATYLAILAMIGPTALTVTTNANIDFMRKPAAGVDLICKARVLKLGRVLAVGDGLIYGVGQADPVARAALTYSIPPQSVPLA